MKKRRHILVVDDEAELRRLLSWILTDLGHDVETAADGTQALECLHRRLPELMILDILMPGVDGWDVLRSLEQLPVRPPVLVLTGLVDYPSFLRAIREGASAFLVKPFRFQDLIGTCQRMLDVQAETRDDDRRRDVRRMLITDVDLLSSEGAPLARGDLVNMSVSGARLDLGAPLREGDSVRLAVHVPGQIRALRIEGVIQWQRPAGDGFAHGLRFEAMGTEETRFIEEILGP
jgi:CheY-like chemotaxis protein